MQTNTGKSKALTFVLAILTIITSAVAANVLNKKIVTPEKLGGKERILTYLSTDKPVYRTGEKVYLRAVALQADTNFPHNKPGHAQIKIKGPKGDIVYRSASGLKDSVAGMAWQIPDSQPGGQYTAIATVNGSAQTRRKFEIRKYSPPRLKTQIEFLRKGYGPGDDASASVNVKRAEGGIPDGAKVTAVARVDGKEVFRKDGLKIDDNGNCSANFKLPEQIEVGDGTLAFIIEDGGVKETASKTIPILLQNLDITFYPEGGELVAGIPCRVYVQARRPDGKSADIEGVITSSPKVKSIHCIMKRGQYAIKTTHEGRGIVSFIPIKGRNYYLTLSKPAGIDKTFKLPEIKPQGATIKALRDVYPYDGKIALGVDWTKNSGATKVTLYKREVELDSQPLPGGESSADKYDTQLQAKGKHMVSHPIINGKAATVTLDAKEAEGVLIATVWDANDNPLAERLIFRKPKFAVNIKVTPKADAFVPGNKVTLDIEATDANGSPVEAVVGLTVTDDAVLEMIDKREQAPNLPVMVYLENEVKDLADAHVYFDANNPQASEDIDLLLGTQGWRRFVLVKFDDLMKLDAESIRRVLAQMQRRRPVLLRANGGRARGMNDFKFKGMAVKKAAMVDAKVDQEMAKPENEEPKEVMRMGLIEDKAVKADVRNIPVFIQPEKPKPAPLVKARAIKGDRLMAEEMIMAPRRKIRMMPRIIIREYAYKARPNRKPNDRIDFTETLYWNSGVKTNPRTGKASVTFDLSDSVTTFKVLADAFGNNGALGAATHDIKSLEPFYIEPKLPQQVTAGDTIDLPIAVINSTDKDLGAVNMIIKGEGFKITQALRKSIGLNANQRIREMAKIVAPQKAGVYTLVITAAAGSYSDTVTKKIIVAPLGFPVTQTAGGQLGPKNPFGMNVDIPADVEPGSMTVMAKIFPSPLANMEEALNALIRQPYGCFEQTSSTTYPLIMAQQYFTTHHGVDPQKIARAKEMLDKGYKKLTGFECKKKGYEWFGGDPAHEALTAYGLLEFNDMSKVMDVDKNMIARTRKWIMDRRDGKGGFKRNKRALDSFGRAPQCTTNAYVIWALIESGEDPSKLEREIKALKAEAMKSKDSYIIALVANILYKISDTNLGDAAEAKKLSQKLLDAMEKDGSVGGAETSITRSGGDSLKIETTSLAVLAWLKDGSYADAVEKSMKWLFERCKAGRFGSTQSTVLALKAINAYDQSRAKPEKPGSVQLMIDGKPFGNAARFDKDTKGALELPNFAAAMTKGNHRIELVMNDGVKMPFAIEIKYNTPKPQSSEKCDLRLETKLSADTIAEGEPLEAAVKVTVGKEDAPTPIAIIGIPAGLQPRHDQLKELVGAGRISSYEIIGNEVVLYWRALKAGSVVEVPLSLTATIPGNYTASASRAYLYYTDEYKDWIKGMSIIVRPR